MKPYVIGLDLGGTNSVFGIVDSRGEIKATTAIKTQSYETGTSPIRILNDAIKYKNGMRVPISHRNFNICHFPQGLLK